MEPLVRAAPAKINLGLNVLRRRADGYHDVQTALLPLKWADELRATPAPALALRCSDPELPTDERNLVVRAALALAGRAGVTPTGALELVKRVPYGAGLGGGSSDAAAALMMLADLWDVAPDGADLHALASTIGADVPFFLEGRPAIATGRGDVLRPLLDAAGAPYRLPFHLVVVVPPARIATASAYATVTPDDSDRPDLAAAVRSNDPDRWRREIVNDFQAPIAASHASVAQSLSELREAGAAFVSLSGSGSAVFGVFEGDRAAAAAAEAMRAEGSTVWLE